MTLIVEKHFTRTLGQKLKSYFQERSIKRAQRKLVRKRQHAQRVVEKSDQAIAGWKDFLEFHVFKAVQGDHLTPDTIHGQSLILHFNERVVIEDFDESTVGDKVICSDADGRWFELLGSSGEYASLTRINADKGAEYVTQFNALKALAASPKPA
ncbi:MULTISPECIES: hypothetical protein [Pseudomonas]|uniref:hypothetical protein n=1 Tax=Pseudomonas TaxID=286 RepID=UPI000F03E302|nr:MULTISPECIES: hypothetical protein [Pseudomonas]MBD8615054.1 hypothetical protein [Pseudomonas putida]MBD8681271.1 hypothetical protein [Pseudomonas sp. CFBP 13719]